MPANFEEQEERRAQVWKLHLRGISSPKIAKELSFEADLSQNSALVCSPRTVDRDIELMRARAGEAIEKSDPTQVLAEVLEQYKSLHKDALRDYEAMPTTTANARVGFLKVAMDALGKIVSLMQDTGYLERNLGHLRNSVEVSTGVPVHLLSTETLELVMRELDELKSGPTLTLPPAEFTDVEAEDA